MQIDPEKLFLRTMNDLRIRCNGDWYDLIRAGALLRQLLLDGSENLYDAANKKYKITPVFDVAISDLEPWKKAYSFHNIWYGKNRQMINKEKFLGTPVVIYD